MEHIFIANTCQNLMTTGFEFESFNNHNHEPWTAHLASITNGTYFLLQTHAKISWQLALNLKASITATMNHELLTWHQFGGPYHQYLIDFWISSYLEGDTYDHSKTYLKNVLHWRTPMSIPQASSLTQAQWILPVVFHPGNTFYSYLLHINRFSSQSKCFCIIIAHIAALLLLPQLPCCHTNANIAFCLHCHHCHCLCCPITSCWLLLSIHLNH